MSTGRRRRGGSEKSFVYIQPRCATNLSQHESVLIMNISDKSSLGGGCEGKKVQKEEKKKEKVREMEGKPRKRQRAIFLHMADHSNDVLVVSK